MASVKISLDRRSTKKDGTHPLKLVISHHNGVSHISLNVSLLAEHWDEVNERVVARPDRQMLNSYISTRKHAANGLLLSLLIDGTLHSYNATTLKKYIAQQLTPEELRQPATTQAFVQHFQHFADLHNKRSREICLATLRHLEKFMGDGLSTLTFEQINKDWLLRFDRHLAQTSPSRNARNIHLRNIRAVFNDAIDNALTTAYPFRKFPIRAEETPHRTLSVGELRTLFSYPCEDWQEQYVDMFKLTFFLIGINVVDLFRLKEIVNGRVEYYRAKTHKLYSIKVEPEAREIIECYKGKTALLSPADTCKNYRTFAMRLNSSVQHVGNPPLFPTITTYWMRHTWATIAYNLGVPYDTIALALGHGNKGVTSIYIKPDLAKVDDANRRVMDYVLYDKA